MARDLDPIVRCCLRSNRVNWQIVIVSRLESRDGGSFVRFSVSDNGAKQDWSHCCRAMRTSCKVRFAIRM